MSKNVDDRAVTVSVKIYERLLATYPATFRREYGPAMKQLFRDQCRDAWSEAQGCGLAGLWLRVLPDLAKTSFVEHLSNLNQRESIFMRMMRALRGDPRLRATFKRAFTIVFIGAIVFSALVAVWSPRVYSGIAIIEVQKDTPEVSLLHPNATYNVGNSDPYFVTTQLKIIQSYSILTNVIVDMQLYEKLPAQLGKPPWTVEETYVYLSKMIRVENTPTTPLLEIAVKNPNPQMAANIANAIADAYRTSRLQQWKETHTGGIEAYRNNLVAKAELLRTKQTELDTMRDEMGISEPDPQDRTSEAVESKMMQTWAEREVAAEADYLEYSNILFKVDQIPRDQLASELPIVYRNLKDAELSEKSVRLSAAKDQMTAAKVEYGVENPRYKVTLKQLELAQQEYDSKIDGIVRGIKNRVEEDSDYLQIVEQKQAQIKANKNKKVEVLRVYYSLKDNVENLRYNMRESERYLNQVIAEVGQPNAGIVIVRDPARPEHKPVAGRPWTFLTWMLGGTLLALVAGGTAAWIAILSSRPSHGQSALP